MEEKLNGIIKRCVCEIIAAASRCESSDSALDSWFDDSRNTEVTGDNALVDRIANPSVSIATNAIPTSDDNNRVDRDDNNGSSEDMFIVESREGESQPRSQSQKREEESQEDFDASQDDFTESQSLLIQRDWLNSRKRRATEVFGTTVANTDVTNSTATTTVGGDTTTAAVSTATVATNTVTNITRDDDVEPRRDTCLRFKRLSSFAFPPFLGSSGAIGYDLRSAHTYEVPPNDRALIMTDLSIRLPPGTYGRVAPRSGLALKQYIDVGAGVIDPDYIGNVGILLINHGKRAFRVDRGDRVAQLICERAVFPKLRDITKKRRRVDDNNDDDNVDVNNDDDDSSSDDSNDSDDSDIVKRNDVKGNDRSHRGTSGFGSTGVM